MRTSQVDCHRHILRRFCCVFAGAVVGLILCGSELDGQETQQPLVDRTDRVDFRRDVWPILSSHCLACHGDEDPESGFRMDSREHLLRSGDGHAPNVVVGQAAASNLIRFASGQVPQMQMPPDGDPLSPEELEILACWIEQGVAWAETSAEHAPPPNDWWSLRPLDATAVPVGASAESHPIDAFIRAKLAEQQIQPSPPADRRTLIRRLYFDLLGLPPSPEEVQAFVVAPQPDAYEQLVDRLLASPHYGERWARHWMDASHFAETHGHDQDRVREHAWPYRDYLIAAFNQDKPYAQFVQEQIAGDALFPDDPLATVALGFLAAGPWDESSLRDIREDTLDRQIARYLDRDDILANIMNNFVSLTVQCARCHDHKFDPIPQADYYALQAVFSGVERANRPFDSDPALFQTRRDLLARQRRLSRGDAALDAELLTDRFQAQVAAWEQDQAEAMAAWHPLALRAASGADGTSFTSLEDQSLLAVGPRPERDTYTLTISVPAGDVTCLRLEVLTDPSLPQLGPGRQDNGNLHLSEFEVYRGDVGGERLTLSRASADFEQEGWGIAQAIDGNSQTAWGIFPRVGESHTAIFELAQRQTLAADETWTVVLKQLHGGGHLIGRLRVSLGSNRPTQHRLPPPAIQDLFAIAAPQRSSAQRLELARFVQQVALSEQLAALPPPTYVYAVASDFEPDGGLKPPPGPRPVHVLRRGDIRQPLSEAAPGSLTCVAGLPARFDLADAANEAERRAALARWLADRENPLVWRSIVNRVWQKHFGRGLVASLNDFGRMGELPTHPELLDWLAVWFRDHGQSLKQLHRLIVTSDTYRQSSAGRSPEDRAMQVDPSNRLAWRSDRSRLDAECIRDTLLSISGKLDLRMGGPSDRQFDLQPGTHVTPIVDYQKFDLANPAAYRRSVYRFLFRTLPDPFMESLDCPAGDLLTPSRDNGVTVQQALALWNDGWAVRLSELFAERLQREQASVTEQVRRAFQLALTRDPDSAELAEFTRYAEQHGVANFCRVLVNLNEFVFVD